VRTPPMQIGGCNPKGLATPGRRDINACGLSVVLTYAARFDVVRTTQPPGGTQLTLAEVRWGLSARGGGCVRAADDVLTGGFQ